jgi:ABC-type nickel/cobalt efflux system permease component RcnA
MVYIATSIKTSIMKTKVSRTIALLLLVALGFTSCSTEYRERRAHRHNDRDHGHDRSTYRN